MWYMLKAMLAKTCRKKKAMKKIIVLRSFCLNLGRENDKFFNWFFFSFPREEWKYFKRWGFSCECLNTTFALISKSVRFSVSNTAKIFCLEKAGMCYYFQCVSCKKKKSVMKRSLCWSSSHWVIKGREQKRQKDMRHLWTQHIQRTTEKFKPKRLD